MKKTCRLIVAVIMIMCLSACGSSKTSESAYNAGAYDSDRSLKVNSGANGYVNDYSETEAADTYEEAVEETAAPEDYEGSVDSDVTDKKESDNKLDTTKLIYKCNISLETLKFNETIAELDKLITKYDAFLESENTYVNSSGYGESGLGAYSATIRVPSKNYKDFVSETGGIGTLKSKNQNVTNMSQEYSDLSVELEVLQAQKTDYMEMLKEAKSLEDMDNVILISDKIASINVSINQIKTRMNSIDNDVAYSYVDISIQEVKEIVEHTEDSFGDRFMKEVKQSWYDFGYGCQQFIIWIVANIWGLLIFAGVICLIIFIIKKIIKKAKKRAKDRPRPANPYMYNQRMMPQQVYPSETPVQNVNQGYAKEPDNNVVQNPTAEVSKASDGDAPQNGNKNKKNNKRNNKDNNEA